MPSDPRSNAAVMRKHSSFGAGGRPPSAARTADPGAPDLPQSSPPGPVQGRTPCPHLAPGAEERHPRLHEIFEARADLRPGAVAVTSVGERLTYLELEERANRLARHRRARRVRRGSRWAFLLPRSREASCPLPGDRK